MTWNLKLPNGQVIANRDKILKKSKSENEVKSRETNPLLSSRNILTKDKVSDNKFKGNVDKDQSAVESVCHIHDQFKKKSTFDDVEEKVTPTKRM